MSVRWDDDSELEAAALAARLPRRTPRARGGEEIVASVELFGVRIVLYRRAAAYVGKGRGRRPRVALRGFSRVVRDSPEAGEVLRELLDTAESPEELLGRARMIRLMDD